jgi:predicted acylesterase/phospholipase RssA
MSDDDHAVPEPAPLLESPPLNRFCDLVLTGGVASGVVYPWAIVELAREFRFKNIGGTSVGAMAAAVTAAAEYGRRYGTDRGFEVLRQMPRRLAEEQAGDTKMLSLFQPSPRGHRLFQVFVAVIRKYYASQRSDPPRPGGANPPARAWRRAWHTVTEANRARPWIGWLIIVARVYRCPASVGAAAGAAIVALAIALSGWPHGLGAWLVALLALIVISLIAATIGVVSAILDDVRTGVLKNDLGVCRGGPEPGAPDGQPGLVAWLHEAIQEAADLEKEGKPLTFADLWHAPLVPGGRANGDGDPDSPGKRSINLEMVTTNVTHGRPYRLPLRDDMSRLFFREEQMKRFFPEAVVRHLMRVSEPYRPKDPDDPPSSPDWEGLREMPGGEMPIVVAARLSLSFPLLFSTVPLYAIDYESRPRVARKPQLCRFSDGGLCSNFPIHLFDAAIPRWPTFGMWLDQQRPRSKRAVWLPSRPNEGRADSWYRCQPVDGRPRLKELSWFLWAGFMTAKDWKDRYGLRMPHVRNRVARLYLKPGEGELNIAMSGSAILHMAHCYGTKSGALFVKRFVNKSTPHELPRHWREHLAVRFHLLLRTVRERLIGLTAVVAGSPYSMSIDELIEIDRLVPDISDADRQSMRRLLDALRTLDAAFEAEKARPLPYRPVPEPELRMRTPV